VLKEPILNHSIRGRQKRKKRPGTVGSREKALLHYWSRQKRFGKKTDGGELNRGGRKRLGEFGSSSLKKLNRIPARKGGGEKVSGGDVPLQNGKD